MELEETNEVFQDELTVHAASTRVEVSCSKSDFERFRRWLQAQITMPMEWERVSHFELNCWDVREPVGYWRDRVSLIGCALMCFVLMFLASATYIGLYTMFSK